MSDDRFGPNGAVLTEMTEAQRAEHAAAARLAVPRLGWAFAATMLTVVGVVVGSQTLLRSSWYDLPPWAWPALMTVIVLGFAETAIRQRRPGIEISQFGRALGGGVLIAFLWDAALQYRAASSVVGP